MESESSLPFSEQPAITPVLSHMDPVHSLQKHFLQIHLTLTSVLSIPSFLFFRLTNPNVVLFLSLMRATYATHLVFLYLIILIVSVEESKLRSSSLCNRLQLLGFKYSLQHTNLRHTHSSFLHQDTKFCNTQNNFNISRRT
jgi:hypothetical protein